MARWNRLTAWVFLFLCLQLAVARALVPVRRQEGELSTTPITSSVRSGTTQEAEATTSPLTSIRSASVTTTESPSLSSTVSSSSVAPTASGGSHNSTLFNSEYTRLHICHVIGKRFAHRD